MRRVACLIIAVLLAGCGGGGGAGGNGAPVLSNLSIFPPRATLNEGVGGMIDVSGSVDFTDGGGDLDEVWVQVYDSGGALLDNIVLPVQGGGIANGMLVGAFSVGTSATGVVAVKINAKDAAGNVSNTVTAMFVVALPPSTTTPPTVLEPGHTVIRLSGDAGLYFGSARAESVSIGPTGDVYVGDPQRGRIYRLDPVTGSGSLHSDGLPPGLPLDICWAPSGEMFATSNATFGNVWEITGGSPVSLATVPGIPAGVIGIAGGFLLVSDSVDSIWRISPLGLATPILTGLRNPSALALDDAGFLYFSAATAGGASIFRSSTGGSPSATLQVPLLPAADRIAVDDAGNIYASDRYSASIYKVSGGNVSLFASGFGGIGVWGGPAGLAIDDTGALYVADGDHLWKITTP